MILANCETLDDLSQRAAELFVQTAQEAVSTDGRFTVVLCGGRTPQSLYGRLAEPPFRQRIPWTNVVVFWGDERCVPPDHPESNYRMASEILLSKVPIPASHIYRMAGERQPPEAAARQYEETLHTVFMLSPGTWPRFDLALLGLGEDGHTASLFPHTDVLNEQARLVAAPFIPQLNAYRLTLTVPVLNAAHHAVFLVSGQSKAAVLKEILQGPPQPDHLPAQRIHPNPGDLLWLIDQAAGGRAGGRR